MPLSVIKVLRGGRVLLHRARSRSSWCGRVFCRQRGSKFGAAAGQPLSNLCATFEARRSGGGHLPGRLARRCLAAFGSAALGTITGLDRAADITRHGGRSGPRVGRAAAAPAAALCARSRASPPSTAPQSPSLSASRGCPRTARVAPRRSARPRCLWSSARRQGVAGRLWGSCSSTSAGCYRPRSPVLPRAHQCHATRSCTPFVGRRVAAQAGSSLCMAIPTVFYGRLSSLPRSTHPCHTMHYLSVVDFARSSFM